MTKRPLQRPNAALRTGIIPKTSVRAVSVANSAVEVLRYDTDVPARSVAAELWQWSQDRERLRPRDLLIIDVKRGI